MKTPSVVYKESIFDIQRFCRFIFMIGTSLVIYFMLFFSSSTFAEKIPMEAWIHDPLISQVSVSPDGNSLVALTLSDVNKVPDITVWDTRALNKAPKRFKPRSTKALSVGWLSNDKLLVVGRQKYDYRVGGKPTKWFRDVAYVVDSQSKKFTTLFRNRDDIIGVSIENTLPEEPKHVLVKITNNENADEFMKVNLKNFTSKRVYRGGGGKSYFTDVNGKIIVEQKIKGSSKKIHFVLSIKHPVTDKWSEHFKTYAAKREGVSIIQIAADNSIYVVDNTNSEYNVIRPYDIDKRTLGEPVFADPGYEMLRVLFSTQPKTRGKVIGYLRQRETVERIYTDPFYIDLQKKIDSALPKGQTHTMTSMSHDLSMITIRSSGIREPGKYHLLVNGSKMVSLGSEFPFLKPEQLAEMKFVTYKARDGMEIPAFLTLPSNGKGPFPTVIMPHGGPWARDSLRWDPWAQFLANRGYAVLQPQYRGSEGFGQTLWRAGDREWGQKMQDDKDDGAHWLVKQGIADKDRLAMYGYSYGGYAAMAAIVREDTPYQCAVAGAGLSELDTFDKITFTNEFNRQFQNPTIAGLSPYKVAKKAKIPIFIFHGDRDQRVPVNQSRKYVAALKRHKKDVEYLEIPDLWHSNPWFPQHRLAFYSSIEDYLANRCGPGGL